jgi:AraC family transcriptional regulator of adaptative response / DNA-3-methyladenine glycosylase II
LQLHQGLRLPSGWDPIETAIGPILGQLVSVERGRALLADLIELAGRRTDYIANGKQITLFPAPEEILAADLTTLKTTRIRKNTLIEFCKALIEKKLSLEATQDIQQFMKSALAIKGIGPWSASYIALKALRDTDSFPASDLILARALKHHPMKTIEKMSPWKGYVAVLLWKNYAQILKKNNKVRRKAKS